MDNRQFLTDLFAGPFRSHAIIASPEVPPRPWMDDVSVPARPVKDWLPWLVDNYEALVRYHEAIGDDSVPYARIWTGTQLFAAAFGCDLHVIEDNNPCAMPMIQMAEEADRLEIPTLDAPSLSRVFEIGHLLRNELDRMSR